MRSEPLRPPPPFWVVLANGYEREIDLERSKIHWEPTPTAGYDEAAVMRQLSDRVNRPDRRDEPLWTVSGEIIAHQSVCLIFQGEGV